MKTKKGSVNKILFILVIILAVVQVIMLNKFSTIGEKLIEVNDKIKMIEKDNSRLTEKIASASSITVVLTKAQNLGLSKLVKTASILSPVPIAYNSRLTL